MFVRTLAGPRAAQVCILAASVFFYTWWNPANLPYLLGSILVNWLIGRWIGGSAPGSLKRKRLLQLGLFLNVAYLCVFKYLNLFLRGLSFIIPASVRLPDLSFPLGISFFTLTQIMYLVDCYEGLLPASSLFDHATFVSFFPYVISGPISRAKRIIHQFGQLGGRPGFRSEVVSRGVYLFSLGLFKKVIFADAFARVANYGFSTATHISAIEAWIFSGAYTLQIYFDFSGYSDMAIGSASMLDIELPRNFDAPLKSLSIIEFWQRWHISLTGFITTYLYTPILKSFRKATLTAASIATLIAMTIAGLWHGPSWTFVIFGVLHGIGLVVNQYWKKKKFRKPPAVLSWLLTFSLINVAFIFFRSPSANAAVYMISRLVYPHDLGNFHNLSVMRIEGLSLRIFGLPLIFGLFAAFFGKSSEQRAREFQPTYANSLLVASTTLASWVFMNSNIAAPFVYFKF